MVACTADQYRSAVLILMLDPPEIYALGDLEDPLEEYRGPVSYLRCSDDLFRPAQLKRALGL